MVWQSLARMLHNPGHVAVPRTVVRGFRAATAGPLLRVLALTLAFAQVAVADAGSVTPLRLSYLEGQASLWRPGADDWAPAQLNLPTGTGDTLYTAERSIVELQFGLNSYLRAAEQTEFQILEHGETLTRFAAKAGQLVLQVGRLDGKQQVSVATPQGTLQISSAGYYRIDATGTASRFSVRDGGYAELVLSSGEPRRLFANQSAEVGDGASTSFITPSGEPDGWDRWNMTRSASLADSSSARYVSNGVYGTELLDRYGAWQTTPEYGAVWMPSGVSSTWVPYSTGSWAWDSVYGWTWVDAAPWGWAPFHYGRWVHWGGRWGWAPGPRTGYSVYAPALVAFFGSGGFGNHFHGPAVGWVSLGWNEPICPWWGGRGWRGRPQWLGWNGPHDRNDGHHREQRPEPIQEPPRYRNSVVPHAIVAVDGQEFGRRPVRPINLYDVNVRKMQPLRGDLPVKPLTGNILPNVGQAERPPRSKEFDNTAAERLPRLRPPATIHVDSPPAMRNFSAAPPRQLPLPNRLGEVGRSMPARAAGDPSLPARQDQDLQIRSLPPLRPQGREAPIAIEPGNQGLRLPRNFQSRETFEQRTPEPWSAPRSVPAPASDPARTGNRWPMAQPMRPEGMHAPEPARIPIPAPVQIEPGPGRIYSAPIPQMPALRRDPDPLPRVQAIPQTPRAVAPPAVEVRPMPAMPNIRSAPVAPMQNQAPAAPHPQGPRRP